MGHRGSWVYLSAYLIGKVLEIEYEFFQTFYYWQHLLIIFPIGSSLNIGAKTFQLASWCFSAKSSTAEDHFNLIHIIDYMTGKICQLVQRGMNVIWLPTSTCWLNSRPASWDGTHAWHLQWGQESVAR